MIHILGVWELGFNRKNHVKIIVCNIIVKYTFTWQHVKSVCNVTFSGAHPGFCQTKSNFRGPKLPV